MTLNRFLAEHLQVTELQAAELYDMREHLAALAKASSVVRDLALRRFNHHLETIASPEKRSNCYLAFKRGRAQEALEFPDVVKSIYSTLMEGIDAFNDYRRQLELEEAND